MKMSSKIFRLIYLLFVIFSVQTNLDAETSDNYHAIIIAIDDYKSEMWFSLNNSVNDANSLGEVLKSKYGFSTITTIYDKRATRINIISTIEKELRQLKENDQVIIFYSGHSKQINNETYWIPTEAETDKIHELIPTTEIKNIIAQSKSKHILLLVNGLFNNTLINSPKSPVNKSADYFNKVNSLLSRQILISQTTQGLHSNRSDKSFVNTFVEVLNQNEKSQVVVEELFTEFSKNSISSNQPTMFGYLQNSGHEGGQFIFMVQDTQQPKLCDSPVYFEEGEIVQFDESGGVLHAKTNFKNVTYEWSFNSKLLDENGPNLAVKKSGIYGVTIIMENGDCSNSAISEVTIVMPEINIEIAEGQKVEFTKNGTLNASFSGYDKPVMYEWKKGNFVVGNNASLEVTESDVYTIIIKLPDGRELGQKMIYVTIKHQIYIVQLGDNIKRIARKFYSDESGAALIYKANPTLREGDVLKVGTELLIPNRTDIATKLEQLTVGTSNAFAPFAYADGDNGGMLTEVVSAVYKEMNQPIEVKYIKGQRIKGIYSGLTDLGFPFTKNRNDELLYVYSEPIYKSLIVFFANKNSKVKSVEETVKRRIRNGQYTKLTVAIPINFICDALLDYVEEEYLLLKPYLTVDDCFEAMKNGEVDLLAVPQVVGLVTIQNASNLNRESFKVLEEPIETATFHVVVSRQHPEAEILIRDFDVALDKAKQKGIIGNIIDKHIDLIQQSRP